MTRTPVSYGLLTAWIDTIAEMVRTFVDAEDAKREDARLHSRSPSTFKHFAADWYKRVGYDVAAYIGLKCMFDVAHRPRVFYTPLALRISGRILDELRYRELQRQCPELLEWKLKHFATRNYDHMQRSLDHAVRELVDPDTVEHLRLPTNRRLQLGGMLIDFMAQTDLIDSTNESVTEGSRPRLVRVVRATSKTLDWLMQREEHLAWRQGGHLPMVVPPNPWAFNHRGGYRFALNATSPLTRQQFVYLRDEAEKQELPAVYDALNTLQAVPWNVNESVFRLIEDLYSQEREEPLPPKPADIDTNEEAKEEWVTAAGKVYSRNYEWKCEQARRRRILDTAGLFLNDTFYFPYSLDFRGRIYPIADCLHPQGEDCEKALLQFATGKVLTQDGANWLAIHGANCMGQHGGVKMSRLTFDERIQWVYANEPRIIRAANNPLEERFWQEADEPYQFFAFCVEWAALLEADAKGQQYTCCLPVHMDGTCNGLQHFAAMFRDEVGGLHVNVVPSEQPHDIYQELADYVIERLEALDEPLARRILAAGIVTRKLAKRPTMTFGYGSKEFGFKRQIREYLTGLSDFDRIDAMLQDDSGQRGVGMACRLLARLLWEGLQVKVVKAAEGMQWLQQCAMSIAKENKGVRWTVPVTGLPVTQNYWSLKTVRVNTILLGSAFKARLAETTKDINQIKETNSISPNVIHSLDAAALVGTLRKARDAGLQHFSMVHDSYGTLPEDCSTLARCTREAFVEMYTPDIAQELLAQFREQTTEFLPEPPGRGELQLEGVLKSRYFFA